MLFNGNQLEESYAMRKPVRAVALDYVQRLISYSKQVEFLSMELECRRQPPVGHSYNVELTSANVLKEKALIVSGNITSHRCLEYYLTLLLGRIAFVCL